MSTKWKWATHYWREWAGVWIRNDIERSMMMSWLFFRRFSLSLSLSYIEHEHRRRGFGKSLLVACHVHKRPNCTQTWMLRRIAMLLRYFMSWAIRFYINKSCTCIFTHISYHKQTKSIMSTVNVDYGGMCLTAIWAELLFPRRFSSVYYILFKYLTETFYWLSHSCLEAPVHTHWANLIAHLTEHSHVN